MWPRNDRLADRADGSALPPGAANFFKGLGLLLGLSLGAESLAATLEFTFLEQLPANPVAENRSVSYSFRTRNLSSPQPRSIGVGIRIFVNGSILRADSGQLSTDDCIVDPDFPSDFACNDLAEGESQEVSLTWLAPPLGQASVVFQGAYQILPEPDPGAPRLVAPIRVDTQVGIAASISATQAEAFEEDLRPGAFTVRLSSPAPAAGLSVNLAPAAGTAVPGVDYQPLPSSVAIAAGRTTAVVSLTPRADALAEPDETVVLALRPGSGYALGTPASATVVIVDSPPLPEVTLSSDKTVLAEADETATLTATLDRAASQPVEVLLGYTGSATAGADYFRTGVIAIPSGGRSGSLTVRTIDDLVAEGDESIVVDIVNVNNAVEAGIQRLQLRIEDDDTAGITVNPTSLVTDENGRVGRFDVVLDSQPTAAVSIGLRSSDPGEGVIDRTGLLFSPGDWDTPQTVAVRGVDDLVADGSVDYRIVTAPAVSTDPNYAGLDAADVVVVNVDDDDPVADIGISRPSGNTGENGQQATVIVFLNTAPRAEVLVTVASDDPSEGIARPDSLRFTPTDWQAGVVTVVGQDDAERDGDVGYFVLVTSTDSSDPDYDGRNPIGVELINVDNEADSGDRLFGDDFER